MLDTEKVRLIMQLRNAGIDDLVLLSAIEKTPRHLYLPRIYEAQAYEDVEVQISPREKTTRPSLIARALFEMQVSKKDIVLEIGTGTGFQTAVLSKLARRVYTIERSEDLFKHAHKQFYEQSISNITNRYGDGSKGWPHEMLFDKIIINGAVSRPPAQILSQLKMGGCLMLPLGLDKDQQYLTKIIRQDPEDVFVRVEPADYDPLVENHARRSLSVSDVA